MASLPSASTIGSSGSSSFSGSIYSMIPVPAGMSLPMITFSFKPLSGSTLPLIAASVRTRVVSWKEAADMKESVAIEALVMPSSSGV